MSNASLSGTEAAAHAPLDAGARSLLRDAVGRMALTARGRDRVLKVARTIADLQVSDDLAGEHVAEALAYR